MALAPETVKTINLLIFHLLKCLGWNLKVIGFSDFGERRRSAGYQSLLVNITSFLEKFDLLFLTKLFLWQYLNTFLIFIPFAYWITQILYSISMEYLIGSIYLSLWPVLQNWQIDKSSAYWLPNKRLNFVRIFICSWRVYHTVPALAIIWWQRSDTDNVTFQIYIWTRISRACCWWLFGILFLL